MSPFACSFIVCWFPLSFTTCFGLHGHLQVCRILHMFIFIYLRILLRCFFGSLPFFMWSHSACFSFVFCSCAVFLRVFVLCFLAYAFDCLLFIKHMKLNMWINIHTGRWPCRPKHVVKDGGNQHTIKLHTDGGITCNTHWTLQCSRMLKYSIMEKFFPTTLTVVSCTYLYVIYVLFFFGYVQSIEN
jgi:hypothetical protein